MSNQLILGDSPLRHGFPEAISTLEIDLQPALDVLDSEKPAKEAHHLPRTILSTDFATEAMECAIALSTGEILVYRPKSARATKPANEIQQLKTLSHVATEPWRGLSPYFAFWAPEWGLVEAISISEIGRLAVNTFGKSSQIS